MRDEGTLASFSSPDLSGISPAPSKGSSGKAQIYHSRDTAALVPKILGGLGISPADVAQARLAARLNGSDLGQELICAGRATEEGLAAAIAEALGVSAVPITSRDCIVGKPRWPSPAVTACPRSLRTCDEHLRGALFVAPRLEDVATLGDILVRHPARRSLVRVTTPRAITRHLAEASAEARSETARLGLAGSAPSLSAREVLTGPQGIACAGLFAVFIALAFFAADAVILALHLSVLPLFLVGSLWRVRAAIDIVPNFKLVATGDDIIPPMPHPVYSVLVALHRETEMVPRLVAGLAALRWPRSRLEVMLVCEADDLETIAAVEASIRQQPGFEIVLVPPSLPRTKPKALNVALPLATGEFLVLYDAEDRPHPDQLEMAWQAFRRGGERLACLQAPLVIGNGSSSWLSGHFALEYAALFRGFLPWLSRQSLPLPLGGTSNHFRREALVAVGAWDSHNVTEDADLGIRLARNGLAIGTIDAPTGEDAPELWQIWLRQRTRWMKGWMQTWLVHMRHPVRLWRDLGPRGFLAFQVLFFGMVGSGLAHPLSLIFLYCSAISPRASEPLHRWLLVADCVTLVLGYLAYAVLLMKSLSLSERQRFRPLFWSVYFYWMLVSLAVVRAMGQLITAPHRWEKTPHGAASRIAGAAPPECRDPLARSD